MRKPVIAVLGGNSLAVPGLRRLRQLGYYLMVLDRDPQAPGAEVADRYIPVNFSDLACTRAALEGETIDGIIPLNDFGVRTAAQLAQERGLKGNSPRAAWLLTNKVAMKRAWHAAGLPTAEFTASTLDELASQQWPVWGRFPCVVKPAFAGGGSRGVALVDDFTQLAAHVDRTSTFYIDPDVVIEEFIDGTEHTVEVVVHDSQPFVLSISDKQNYQGSVTIVQNLYFPGPIGHRHGDAIRDLVVKACRALEMSDGCAHFEVLVRHGQPYLLEVGGRPGGGINFEPICRLSTGYDYPALLAAVLTGSRPDFQRQDHVHLAWHYFSTPAAGTVESISGFEDLANEPDVIATDLYETVGRPVRDKSTDIARPGFVLLQAADHSSAVRRATELAARVRIAVTP